MLPLIAISLLREMPRRSARHHHHFSRAGLFARDFCHDREFPDGPDPALERHLEQQLVAWNDRAAKARLVDAGKIKLGVLVGIDADRDEAENAGGLRKRF